MFVTKHDLKPSTHSHLLCRPPAQKAHIMDNFSTGDPPDARIVLFIQELATNPAYPSTFHAAEPLTVSLIMPPPPPPLADPPPNNHVVSPLPILPPAMLPPPAQTQPTTDSSNTLEVTTLSTIQQTPGEIPQTKSSPHIAKHGAHPPHKFAPSVNHTETIHPNDEAHVCPRTYEKYNPAAKLCLIPIGVAMSPWRTDAYPTQTLTNQSSNPHTDRDMGLEKRTDKSNLPTNRSSHPQHWISRRSPQPPPNQHHRAYSDRTYRRDHRSRSKSRNKHSRSRRSRKASRDRRRERRSTSRRKRHTPRRRSSVSPSHVAESPTVIPPPSPHIAPPPTNIGSTSPPRDTNPSTSPTPFFIPPSAEPCTATWTPGMTDEGRGHLPEWSTSYNGKPSQKTIEVDEFVPKSAMRHGLSYIKGMQLMTMMHLLSPPACSWTMDSYNKSIEDPVEHVEKMMAQVSEAEVLPPQSETDIIDTETSPTAASSNQSPPPILEPTPGPLTPGREPPPEPEVEGVSSSDNERVDHSRRTCPLGLKVKGHLSNHNGSNKIFSLSHTLRNLSNPITSEITLGPGSNSSSCFLIHDPSFRNKRQVIQIFNEIKASLGTEPWAKIVRISTSKGSSHVRPVRHRILPRTPEPQSLRAAARTSATISHFTPPTHDNSNNTNARMPGYGPPRLPNNDFCIILLPVFLAASNLMTRDDLAVWKSHPTLLHAFYEWAEHIRTHEGVLKHHLENAL